MDNRMKNGTSLIWLALHITQIHLFQPQCDFSGWIFNDAVSKPEMMIKNGRPKQNQHLWPPSFILNVRNKIEWTQVFGPLFGCWYLLLLFEDWKLKLNKMNEVAIGRRAKLQHVKTCTWNFKPSSFGRRFCCIFWGKWKTNQHTHTLAACPIQFSILWPLIGPKLILMMAFGR